MSSSTPRQPEDLAFLLDAPLSYRVSSAFKVIELPFLHVSEIPGFEGDIPGQSPASDEKIAKWCAAMNRIIVTVDDDFKGRSARNKLLTTLGAEVVVLDWQPLGRAEQHRVITYYYHRWIEELAEQPTGTRVWVQKQRGRALIQ